MRDVLLAGRSIELAVDDDVERYEVIRAIELRLAGVNGTVLLAGRWCETPAGHLRVTRLPPDPIHGCLVCSPDDIAPALAAHGFDRERLVVVDQRATNRGTMRFLGPPREERGLVVADNIEVFVRQCGKDFPSPLGEEYSVPCRAAWAVKPEVEEEAMREFRRLMARCGGA